ncbi:MAG: hypothetical protein MJZ37_00815 [Bacilli bacterium]|nr:hypothetical protein [Bacilli bacterium]
MKKIAFASISILMDFSSELEAIKYRSENRGKGWWFGEIYENNSGSELMYSMEIRRPYGSYNPGF